MKKQTLQEIPLKMISNYILFNLAAKGPREIIIKLVVILLFLFFIPIPVFSNERLENIERKVEALDKENKMLKEELENIRIDEEEHWFRLSNLLKISAFASTEYSLTDQEGVNHKFRLKELAMFFRKKIDKWSLNAELEFENGPFIESKDSSDVLDTAQGQIYLEESYIKYEPTIDLSLSFGRFQTPSGLWTIFHHNPFQPTQRGPIHVDDVKMFPHVSDGIQVRKSLNLFDSILDTHLYVANGTGNPGLTDRNDDKAIGARLNYFIDVLTGLQVGTSYYREKDNDNVSKNNFGFHIKLDYSSFELQTEYVMRHNDPDNTTEFYDLGAYAQLLYDLKNWTFAVRYDWYDSNDSTSRTDQHRYTGALNYHFIPGVIGKVEYHRNEFNNPIIEDYNEVIFSILFAVGQPR